MLSIWVLEEIRVFEKSLASRLMKRHFIRVVDSWKDLRAGLASVTHKHVNSQSKIGRQILFLAGDPKGDILKIPSLIDETILVKDKHSCGSVEGVESFKNMDSNKILDYILEQERKLNGTLVTQKVDEYTYQDLSLDYAQFRVRSLISEEYNDLSHKEALLLRLFLEKPEIIHTREEIGKKVWGGAKVSPRTIDSQISRLRKKLCNSEISIENEYSLGYIMR